MMQVVHVDCESRWSQAYLIKLVKLHTCSLVHFNEQVADWVSGVMKAIDCCCRHALLE